MAISEDKIREVLKQVVDPELFVNVVDLGLIYGIEIRPHEESAGQQSAPDETTAAGTANEGGRSTAPPTGSSHATNAAATQGAGTSSPPAGESAAQRSQGAGDAEGVSPAQGASAQQQASTEQRTSTDQGAAGEPETPAEQGTPAEKAPASDVAAAAGHDGGETGESQQWDVTIEMTLTSPACPAGPQLIQHAKAVVGRLEGVANVEIKLVMQPPWTPDRMTDEARDQLGIF